MFLYSWKFRGIIRGIRIEIFFIRLYYLLTDIVVIQLCFTIVFLKSLINSNSSVLAKSYFL